jgi:hypothetical protein
LQLSNSNCEPRSEFASRAANKKINISKNKRDSYELQIASCIKDGPLFCGSARRPASWRVLFLSSGDLAGQINRGQRQWEKKLRDDLAGDRVWSHPKAEEIRHGLEAQGFLCGGAGATSNDFVREYIIRYERIGHSHAFWERQRVRREKSQ